MAVISEKGKQYRLISVDEDLARKLENAASNASLSPEAVLEQAIKNHLGGRTSNDTVYLSSPADAMMKGIYKETATIGDVKLHGNFGLGTFDDLDGEMVMLDGMAYRIKTDGRTAIAGDDVKTPFACATFFNPVSFDEIEGEIDHREFLALMERITPSENMFYGIRIDGVFSRVKLWSVPKQDPNRPIAHVRPAISTFWDVYGTLAGFYTPKFLKALGIPGFHFHFLTDDRTFGGHLKECTLRHARISVQFISRIELDLPSTFDFMTTSMI